MDKVAKTSSAELRSPIRTRSRARRENLPPPLAPTDSQPLATAHLGLLRGRKSQSFEFEQHGIYHRVLVDKDSRRRGRASGRVEGTEASTSEQSARVAVSAPQIMSYVSVPPHPYVTIRRQGRPTASAPPTSGPTMSSHSAALPSHSATLSSCFPTSASGSPTLSSGPLALPLPVVSVPSAVGSAGSSFGSTNMSGPPALVRSCPSAPVRPIFPARPRSGLSVRFAGDSSPVPQPPYKEPHAVIPVAPLEFTAPDETPRAYCDLFLGGIFYGLKVLGDHTISHSLFALHSLQRPLWIKATTMAVDAALLSIPPELIERILTFCHARDVSSFAQTCRVAHLLVYKADDQYLWRELFLAHPFDDPRRAALLSRPGGAQIHDIDWKQELQRRIEAELVASSSDFDGPHLQRVLEALVSVVETALPNNVEPARRSENLRWLDRILYGSRILHEVLPSESESERQLRYRLRSYLSLSHEDGISEESRNRMEMRRKTSRCFVYDMRKYVEETLWGPYRLGDVSSEPMVNWEHVWHIVNVVGMKLREHPVRPLGFYNKPLYQLEAVRAHTAPVSHKRKPHDWRALQALGRGLCASWITVISSVRICLLFAHIHTLNARVAPAFNFSTFPPGPHNASFFDDPFEEAIRPVELQLEVLDLEDYPEGEPSEVDDPNYPPLFFKGFSRGTHSAAAIINGCVTTLADGSVRWHFITTYDGRMQWSAEGVQIGHVCSAAGVAGIWTGASHEDDDPAGPFWMIKVADGLPPGVLNVLF
ncbi:hypothetical protein A0H81_00376 [Grifola frondosa]|uniref:F-box domain-containing protein n=1 Tax=Grifola frondosa TaxID=5627 RepID=A0A1C7MSH0_GRIFR|nr:hypothetical protein A0H81_00376 [Grifola frondosa]